VQGEKQEQEQQQQLRAQQQEQEQEQEQEQGLLLLLFAPSAWLMPIGFWVTSLVIGYNWVVLA
jgi:hypothetical protein